MKYRDKKVMIGLSGGINSMAVLTWLAEQEDKPKDLHLFYAHFKEHSPDTLDFVLAGLEFAKQHFNVIYTQTNNSIIDFFREQKMIPHPMFSVCTRKLKIEPMERYCSDNGIEVDLVGFVRTELKRIKNTAAKSGLFLTKDFPIQEFTNDWCFEIVDRLIGWHPKIYDIRDAKGKRIFSHNNCLPCKNMHIAQLRQVAIHYPELFAAAIDLSKELQQFWGREKDTFEEAFNVTFGREEWQTGGEAQPCEMCSFD